MPFCPRCRTVPLARRVTKLGLVYGCPKCRGRDVAVPVLRQAGAEPEFLKHLWLRARESDARGTLRCPHCHGRMAAVLAGPEAPGLALDVCPSCATVWFDNAELGSVPTVPRPRTDELSPESSEQVALLELQHMEQIERDETGPVPPSKWQWIPLILGMPIEYDAPESKSRPLVTWAVAAFMVIMYAVTCSNLPSAVEGLGFVPARWDRDGGLTIVSSFFMHAGLFHLVSNMYFLLVFGDNVEDRLGPLFFALLLAGSHVAGLALHTIVDPRTTMPCVGASAGITGVLAYYTVMFPRSQLGVFVWFLPQFGVIRLHAIAFLAVFLLMQALGVWMETHGAGGVAYAAHLGGVAVGIAAGIVGRLMAKQATLEAFG